jgi:hypothetical protein
MIEYKTRGMLSQAETGPVDLNLVFECPVVFHDFYMVIQK